MDSCYICLQDSSQEPYVEPNPCACKGSIKMHISCFIKLYEDNNKCIICNTHYTNKLNGYVKIHCDTTGKLKKEGAFKDGKENGLWNYYSEDGKIEEQILIINDKNTISKTYYPSGALKQYHIYFRKFTPVLGEYDIYICYDITKTIQYYETGSQTLCGNIQQEGKLINGEMSGDWKLYYKNGSLLEEGRFNYGKKIGPFKNYYPNGSIHIEKYYHYNIAIGTWNYYDIYGKKIAEESFYPNGVIQRRKDFNLRTWIFYDKDGKKITEIVY